MKKYFSMSEKETEKIAEELSLNIHKNDVVAFTGGMGMGKTAFTRGLVRGFRGDDVVSSPTFALVNEYETPRFPVYHFDMYRVNSWDDLYSTGFFDYLESDAVIIIEWSENILGALPESTVYITIELGENENERVITVDRR